jgi:formyltetrahydrofolate-dependent phosphoribosylglycinamide formyltransferase
MKKDPIKLAVLLSGGGRTLQNFLDRITQGTLPASVEVVIGSKPGLKGLQRAEKAGIPHFTVNRKEYSSAREHSDAINEILSRFDIDLICLAGYLHLYLFPEKYRGRVMNIHPALIPAFCGKGYYGHHVHEAVVKNGVKVSGCTVHFVDEEYDNGPIIVQKTVPVFFEDTPDDVADRVFEQECEAYAEAIRLFAGDRLRVEGQKVKILPED